jgi:uncharacterized protein YeaO (DUF488 family)
MVRTKRVYDEPEPADGVRVLVMRLWPRGIRKDLVDVWLKELGASVDNIKSWKAGRIDWPEMRKRYVAGLGTPAAAGALAELRALARRGTVTLLCSCADETACHRTILKEVLGGAPTARSRSRRRPSPARAPAATRAAPRRRTRSG